MVRQISREGRVGLTELRNSRLPFKLLYMQLVPSTGQTTVSDTTIVAWQLGVKFSNSLPSLHCCKTMWLLHLQTKKLSWREAGRMIGIRAVEQ